VINQDLTRIIDLENRVRALENTHPSDALLKLATEVGARTSGITADELARDILTILRFQWRRKSEPVRVKVSLPGGESREIDLCDGDQVNFTADISWHWNR
jgi:hypothetical protein